MDARRAAAYRTKVPFPAARRRNHDRPKVTTRLLIAGLALGAFVGAAGAAQTEPWRVLVLRSWDAQYAINAVRERAMREAIIESSPRVVDFYMEDLDLLRFSDYEAEMHALLRKKYLTRKIDVVIASGDGPLDFARRHRDTLWPGAPIVFNGVVDGTLHPESIPDNATGVTMSLDIAGTLEIALRLVPPARVVHFVVGTSDFDLAYRRHAQAAMEGFRDRLEARYITDLPRALMVDAVRQVDPESIVVYLTVLRDATGQVFGPGSDTVTQVSNASRAPVFTAAHTLVSRGPVGGSSARFDEHGRAAGELVLRVLWGEPADSIAVRTDPQPGCIADWRALQRWKLDEAKLPSGCEVVGQPTTRSAVPLAAFVGVIVLQLALISALVLQSRRRVRAEAQARLRGAELARAARLSMMGVLTASIAHEINQPLGAILSNADAADIMLERGQFDVERLRAIVTDIRKEDQRAGDVVRGLRAMMRKRDMQLKPVDVNVETADALHTLAYEAARRKVRFTPEFSLDVPIVMADPVHLHQVLVNLLVNAMEAVEESPPGVREVHVRTRADGGGAEIAVMDSGPGLPPGREEEVFDSFFTTKVEGMGMGLSIVRTIIEAHGGRVSAGAASLGGAEFGVWLPAAGT